MERERYFFPGKVGQKQNGTRFPLAADGEMSARLNGHVFHDDRQSARGIKKSKTREFVHATEHNKVLNKSSSSWGKPKQKNQTQKEIQKLRKS